MVANKQSQSGFALLIALIVVGVVLSVGLVILDLTIKQVRLAATTKDSEVAFHAANAGMECARYWRRAQPGLTLVTPAPPAVPSLNVASLNNINCFGQAAVPSTVTPTDVSASLVAGSGGEAHQYQYELTWGPAAEQRCTRINKVLMATPIGQPDTDMTALNMSALIPGYPGTTNVTCPSGSQCSVVAVRGYNQACPGAGNSFGYGVVERKVLLEF